MREMPGWDYSNSAARKGFLVQVQGSAPYADLVE
jgi:hypothetical protein